MTPHGAGQAGEDKTRPPLAATGGGLTDEGMRPLLLETIALSGQLHEAGRQTKLRDWRLFAVPNGVKRWIAPPDLMPEAVGHLSLSRDPALTWRVHVEANLTSLAHSKVLKYASLHSSELAPTLNHLIALVLDVVDQAPYGHESWMVKRFDPSRTYRVGDALDDVLGSARDSWMRRKNGRQTLSEVTSTGRTVTLKFSKGHSWSVYDKSAEHEGAPPGLARVESRVRPQKPLTLAALEAGMNEHDDVDSAIESLTAIVGEAGMQMTQHLIRGGAEPAEALRLGMPALLLAQYGEHALHNAGIPVSSARRIRARIRELLDAAGDLEMPRSGASILQNSEQVFARDEAS